MMRDIESGVEGDDKDHCDLPGSWWGEDDQTAQSRGWPGNGVHPHESTVLIVQAATLTTRSGLAERTNVF
jgi:hypothetical protein